MSFISLKKSSNDINTKSPVASREVWNVRKSKFVQNVAIVATGTAGAQALSILFSPIITRLYSPEAFGILGSFVAIASTITLLLHYHFQSQWSFPSKMRKPRILLTSHFFVSCNCISDRYRFTCFKGLDYIHIWP